MEKLTYTEAYWKRLEEHRKNIKRDGAPGQAGDGLYQCTKCNDTGCEIIYVEVGGQVLMESRTCECQARQRKALRYKQSGIPSAFDSKTFDNFDTFNLELLTMIKNKALEYVEGYSQEGPSLYITGLSGAGKTHLSVAICKALIEKGINVYYMIYREEITKLKQVQFNDEKYADAIEPFKKVELLYIDDLFKGKISDTEVNIIYEIVNYRYNNNLPMIISTEIPIDGVRHIDSAIAGRIEEMCHRDGAKNLVSFGKIQNRRTSA
jgi:DNA replication protein DnaC